MTELIIGVAAAAFVYLIVHLRSVRQARLFFDDSKIDRLPGDAPESRKSK